MNSFIGDLPTWITAFTAIVAAVVAWTQWQSQRTVINRERDREHREHASQLAVWVEKRTEASGAKDSNLTLGLRVHNASELTFSHVAITAMLGEKYPHRYSFLTCPPGDFFIPRNGAKERFPFGFPERISEHSGSDYHPFINSANYHVQEITFHDNTGARWHIDANGILSEIPQ